METPTIIKLRNEEKNELRGTNFNTADEQEMI